MEVTQQDAFWLMIAFLCAIILYLLKDAIRETIVSRKKMRTRHRYVREVIEGYMTQIIEEAKDKGEISDKEAQYHYANLRRAGYREVGPEPSFGKPWYYGVAEIPPAKAVIGKIRKARERRRIAKEAQLGYKEPKKIFTKRKPV